MRVLAFGTYDVRTHPRVGVLLNGLRMNGNTVVELNRPLGIDTSGRVAALSHPTQLVRFAATLLARWFSLAMGSLHFRGSAHPHVVLVGYLGHFDVLLARALFPHARIVLDHLIFAADTAQDRGTGEGLRTAALRRLDHAALSAATVIVVDTPAHRELVPAALRDRVVVVPVGAPTPWFDARRAPEALNRSLSVVFFGLFTPLQGAPTIARGLRDAAARRRIRITMVGTGQDYAQCREILRDTPVDWIDWVDSDRLPTLVAAHDVCVGILGTTPKAFRVVPNKVYQGMAAGCCVVTADTRPQRAILGQDVLWCSAGNAEEFSSIIVSLTDNPELLVEMRRRATRRSDNHFHPAQVVDVLNRRLRDDRLQHRRKSPRSEE